MKLIHNKSRPPIDAHVVRLAGGLGNQMFQYAFGQTLRLTMGLPVHYDARTLFDGGRIEGDTLREYALSHLNVDVTFASDHELDFFGVNYSNGAKTGLKTLVSNLRTLCGNSRVVEEKGFGYRDDVLSKGHTAKYFSGYWQSVKYLSGIEETIRSEFQPRTDLTTEAKDLKQRIEHLGAACVNVRRGDFVSDEKTRKFHGYMDAEYYTSGLKRLRQTGAFDHVFVFSDEPEWCASNLHLPGNIEVVAHRFAGPHFTHYIHLMASCSGFVIPNSTFGWWGAWLSNVSGNQIVSPRNWFADKSVDTTDLIPNSWVRL